MVAGGLDWTESIKNALAQLALLVVRRGLPLLVPLGGLPWQQRFSCVLRRFLYRFAQLLCSCMVSLTVDIDQACPN